MSYISKCKNERWHDFIQILIFINLAPPHGFREVHEGSVAEWNALKPLKVRGLCFGAAARPHGDRLPKTWQQKHSVDIKNAHSMFIVPETHSKCRSIPRWNRTPPCLSCCFYQLDIPRMASVDRKRTKHLYNFIYQSTKWYLRIL